MELLQATQICTWVSTCEGTSLLDTTWSYKNESLALGIIANKLYCRSIGHFLTVKRFILGSIFTSAEAMVSMLILEGSCRECSLMVCTILLLICGYTCLIILQPREIPIINGVKRFTFFLWALTCCLGPEIQYLCKLLLLICSSSLLECLLFDTPRGTLCVVGSHGSIS